MQPLLYCTARYEAMLMAFLELVALSFEQICHHAAGKVATREADAFKGG